MYRIRITMIGKISLHFTVDLFSPHNSQHDLNIQKQQHERDWKKKAPKCEI